MGRVVVGIAGVKEFVGRLNDFDRDKVTEVDKAVHESGFFLQGEVKESIAGQRAEPRSVDTGRFLNSVEVDNSRPLVSEVGSDVEYAEALEYGSSRMMPRAHFQNSVLRNADRILEFIKNAIKTE